MSSVGLLEGDYPLFTNEDKAVIKLALNMGYYQHVIASYWEENQGRISETKDGIDFPDIVPAKTLPADFPRLKHGRKRRPGA